MRVLYSFCHLEFIQDTNSRAIGYLLFISGEKKAGGKSKKVPKTEPKSVTEKTVDSKPPSTSSEVKKPLEAVKSEKTAVVSPQKTVKVEPTPPVSAPKQPEKKMNHADILKRVRLTV